ncbi:relaxase/mobilization nuclease domain-containing protein [Telluribacter sp. SYSU D00476]|uniref:relaxase/mobilization nuclease domain-containing protein n=1 Tax=Telluribacter sp. SYSU D00476 TaxID=2811430 RepID=UPI001FF114C6|nr:relaxase/mobilization nuclease domain-containing protein [Telluribacter sp. SYSU D00476]
MIAKTSIGSDFHGAIHYGAGYHLDGTIIKGKAELLILNNIVSQDPKGIADEMQQEASYGRCKKPVWHTSLSWKPEEHPTREQIIVAANSYCQKMGADPTDHQIVVYQHHDQPHRHIHIYINRVPTDGGPALTTSHNYARNERICREISQELGFAKVERLKDGQLRHVMPNQLEAQQVVQLAIRKALKAKSNNPAEMERRLKEKGIECRYQLEGGRLKYSSYCYQGVAIKGQDVGFTAKQLQARLDKNMLMDENQKTKITGPVGKPKLKW